MTGQNHRLAARAFAEANLAQLATDVLASRKRAALPVGSKVHELASLCIAFASDDDEYLEAERLVTQFALERAASLANDCGLEPEHVSTATGPADQAVIDEEAYQSLLPKLLVLSESIDDMSDDQCGDWIDALPKAEFFEFIGLSHDGESFRSAIAAAKQLVTKSRAVVSAAS